MANQEVLFRALGKKVKSLRKDLGLSQEDMLSFGFSTRHWQQVEAGRPITVTTLLRICEVFETTVSTLAQGLDDGIYEAAQAEQIASLDRPQAYGSGRAQSGTSVRSLTKAAHPK